MADAIKIGSFQFDNLVRNRVPFHLVGVHCPFEKYYKSIDFMHIQNYQIELDFDPTLDQVLDLFEKKKITQETPLVFVCQDGKKSKRWSEVFGDLGYSNAYYLEDGYQSLESLVKDPQINS